MQSEIDIECMPRRVPSACERERGRRTEGANALPDGQGGGADAPPGRGREAEDGAGEGDEPLEDDKDRLCNVDAGPSVVGNGENGGVGGSQNHGGGLIDSAREALEDRDDEENAAARRVDGSCDATGTRADLIRDHQVPDTGGDEVDQSENDANDGAYDRDDDRQQVADAGDHEVGDGPDYPHYKSGGDSVHPDGNLSEAVCGDDDAGPVAEDPDQAAVDSVGVGLDQGADGDDSGSERRTGNDDQRDKPVERTECRADERECNPHRDHERDEDLLKERVTALTESLGRLRFTSEH